MTLLDEAQTNPLGFLIETERLLYGACTLFCVNKLILSLVLHAYSNMLCRLYSTGTSVSRFSVQPSVLKSDRAQAGNNINSHHFHKYFRCEPAYIVVGVHYTFFCEVVHYIWKTMPFNMIEVADSSRTKSFWSFLQRAKDYHKVPTVT